MTNRMHLEEVKQIMPAPGIRVVRCHVSAPDGRSSFSFLHVVGWGVINVIDPNGAVVVASSVRLMVLDVDNEFVWDLDTLQCQANGVAYQILTPDEELDDDLREFLTGEARESQRKSTRVAA